MPGAVVGPLAANIFDSLHKLGEPGWPYHAIAQVRKRRLREAKKVSISFCNFLHPSLPDCLA